MTGQIVGIAVLIVGSLAGHFLVRLVAGPHSNAILQWVGGGVGAGFIMTVFLLIVLTTNPPEVLDPVVVFAQLAPIVGAVAAAVEFVLLIMAEFEHAGSRADSRIYMAVMLVVGCLCLVWLIWYESKLNRRWQTPPPAPVPVRSYNRSNN
jgi:hypothetical protein